MHKISPPLTNYILFKNKKNIADHEPTINKPTNIVNINVPFNDESGSVETWLFCVSKFVLFLGIYNPPLHDN